MGARVLICRVDFTTSLERFARIALTGLNVQQGQSLAIKIEPENIDVATVVAELAYETGVRHVELWPESTRLTRARIDHSREEYLEFEPAYRQRRNEEFIAEKWALLSVKSPVDLSIMDGADARRAGMIARGIRNADAALHRALSNDLTQWTVMAVPTAAWAGAVLDMPPDSAALAAMWEAMEPILRLSEREPAKFWHRHGTLLAERAGALNDLALTSLHFVDGETDLHVPLHERARWRGGGSVTRDGIPFLPNIPTEEVFTAPDAPRVSGRVAITRPVRVYGSLVEGAWFEFSAGTVVDFGAATGRDTLEQFLSMDEGSRRMGEIALVDGSSPIARSGLVFQNILLDENAACHFALGSAYPTCIDGGEKMSESELEAVGANRSRQHVDFMLGSATLSVDGVTADGTERPIMRDGRIVL
jgi:aminopeptidase